MFKMNANVMARKNLSTEMVIKRHVPAQKVLKDVNADPPNLCHKGKLTIKAVLLPLPIEGGGADPIFSEKCLENEEST